jgi:glucose-1-phosphate cytidylyltransferase
MKTVLLAGGLGTRLSEETEVKPKPMVEIGGRPILSHIMRHYAHHGVREFLVALGYKGESIKDYFLNYHALAGSMSVELGSGQVQRHASSRDEWTVHLIETGTDTQTGGRLGRLARWLRDETFCLTYGDGVSDVNLTELLRFHKKHGKLATITAVRPPARFGALELAGDKVQGFAEKAQTDEGWINGGFMVLEPGVLDLVGDDGCFLEVDVLPKLAQRGELCAYQHEGFWQCMDTLRDKRQLETMWQSGKAPWKVWR